MKQPGQPLMRSVAKAVLSVALLASLSGCVEMMVGSAVMGAVATADRRTLGAQTEDKEITVKAEFAVPKVAGPDAHVNIASFNRKVLLTGEVTNAAAKAAVESEVRKISGVESVSNEIEVTGPSTYTSRSKDALITTKVKASLVDMKTVSAVSFKVVTERGNCYLMGIVTPREGNIAADVARGVSGVERVVKMFEYISEEDLKAMQPKQS